MRNATFALDYWLANTTTGGPFAHLVTITPRVGSVVRWTDYPTDVTYSANTYTAGGTGTVPLVEIGRREEVAGTEIGSLEVTLLCGESATFNGVRLPLAAASGALDGATVLVYRHYRPDAGDDYAVHLFQGRVAEAEPSSAKVTLQVESGMVALNVPIPRLRLQPGCGNVLFDTQCGLVKATYTETATVSAGATTTSIPTDRTKADNYFTLGVLTFTSGALNGISRAVRAYANSGGTFTPDRPLSVAPSNGDTFTVYPGCPRTLDACQTKWAADNSARYRGFPFQPTHNWTPSLPENIDIGEIARAGDLNNIAVYRKIAASEAVLPVVYGQNRVKAKFIYVSAPRSSNHLTIVDAIAAVSEGPITGIGLVWRGAGLTPSPPSSWVFTGTRPTQTAWSVVPAAEQLGYPGVAYVAIPDAPINASDLDTFAFEVKGLLHATGNAAGDADPADVIVDVLSDADFGAGVSSSDVVTNVGQDGTAASSYERYVTAEGLWLSPVLGEQRPAISWLREILDATNSEVLWSGGKFKILPLGDSSATGGGVTYTPFLTPRYALGVDDFICQGDEDAIAIERPRDDDTFNTCPVEFANRAPASATADPSQAYLTEVVDDPEPFDLALRGQRRTPPISLHCICLQGVALKIARLRAQRSVLARNTYRFRVGWRFALLEPLDLLTITDPLLGLAALPVRISGVNEDPASGIIEIVAEDWPFGVGTAVAHATQSSDGPVTALPPELVARMFEAMALRNWNERTIPTGPYRAVAWNGTVFCAIGASVCATSPDGLTWTTQTIPSGTYVAITWNGTVFCAIGVACATSPDGITWTARTLPVGETYEEIAWNGSVFCAVGPSYCATSPTGTTWTSRTIPAGTYTGIAWSGTKFAATGFDVAATSPDGTTWTSRTIPTGNYRSLAWGAEVFCAVGDDNKCATSPDGITWTARTMAIPGASYRDYLSIAWTGYHFVAVEYTAAISTAALAVSMNGIQWDVNEVAIPNPDVGWRYIAWSGRVGVVVGTDCAASSLTI